MWEPFLLQIMKEILIDFRSGAKNSASFLPLQILFRCLQCPKHSEFVTKMNPFSKRNP